MMLSFFDVFRFFTEIELTDELRKYELICVSLTCAVFFAASAAGISVNSKKAARREEEKNDADKEQ